MDTALKEFLENGGAKLAAWLASALLGYLALLVRARIKNDNVRGFMLRVFDEIEDAVRSVEQTTASSARDENGKLAADDQVKAKNLALSTVRSNLGPQNLKRLQKVTGVEVNKWLDTRIEATVHDKRKRLKNGAGPLKFSAT